MCKCRLADCSCNGGWSTAMVEKLVATVVDSGGCSRWYSVEAGDKVTGVSCGFVAGAGRQCSLLQELSHQG